MEPFAVVVGVLIVLILLACTRTLCLFACACKRRNDPIPRPMSIDPLQNSYPPSTFYYAGAKATPKGVEAMLEAIETFFSVQRYQDLNKLRTPTPQAEPSASSSPACRMASSKQGITASAPPASLSGELTSTAGNSRSRGETPTSKTLSPTTDLQPSEKPTILSEEDEGPVCVVCMESFRGKDLVYELPCKHVFHTECVIPWFAKSKCSLCPLCKTDVLKQQLEQLPENGQLTTIIVITGRND